MKHLKNLSFLVVILLIALSFSVVVPASDDALRVTKDSPDSFIGMGLIIASNEVGDQLVPYVKDVICGGPAHIAGIKPQDKILYVNGTHTQLVAPALLEYVMATIRLSPEGAPVTFVVARQGASSSPDVMYQILLTLSFKTAKIDKVEFIPHCGQGKIYT